MADLTLHGLLGVSKERAAEIAKKVRESFSESDGPDDWIRRLIDEFGIDEKNAEIFACGWFAGKYAGMSEVFNVVQREMDAMEKDSMEKKNRYGTDGYV
ncbi:MAG: hypothetical protein AB9879_07135 [Methanothrix sp.]